MNFSKKEKETEWKKLDNTANLFPVIANRRMTNVYRMSAVLTEKIEKDILQEALIRILPWFDSMNVRMRTGVFWYYFETNRRIAPLVEEECFAPCRYMNARMNQNFLFRVNYYGCRINLEVFHALADGVGGMTFLKELVYQYLRLKYPQLKNLTGDHLSADTSLNTEDSYVKHFRKGQPRPYQSVSAFHMKGRRLPREEMGVMHGYMSLRQIKAVAKARNLSLNEYLAGNYFYSIYKEYVGELHQKPVVLCVPVNLRPFFDSFTTRNFFGMVSASVQPQASGEKDYTREEITEQIIKQLRQEINTEYLEKLFSYNVANQKNLILRAVPLLVKKLAIRYVYLSSARATTTTMTNLGKIEIEKPYQKYIQRIYAMLSLSEGQNMKATICTYGEELSVTITSLLEDVSVQRRFFHTLAEDGIDITLETNGLF